MALQRLRCEWSGTPVTGPGLSTFYGEADGTLSISAAAAAFFGLMRVLIPDGGTITIPNGGDLIDEATGTLVGSWGSSGSTTHDTTGTGRWAAGVGARVVWQTDQVRNGHRVRGSTFVLPLISNAYEDNGTLGGTTVTALEDAVEAFMVQAPTQARVWSRPRPGIAGAAVPILRGEVPDKVSWLRSRRI